MKYLILTILSIVILNSAEREISSSDGFKLYGSMNFKKDSTTLVVFAHQFLADRNSWGDLPSRLFKLGISTLNLDLRGHGKSIFKDKKQVKVIQNSENFETQYKLSSEAVDFSKIPSDLTLWLSEYVDYFDRVILVGSSLGAKSILPLTLEFDISKVVIISVGELSDESELANAQFEGESLYIVGSQDRSYPRTLKLFESSIDGKLIALTSNGHGVVLLDEVKEDIIEFIKED